MPEFCSTVVTVTPSTITSEVGEFVTDPRLLLPVLAAAPAGWEAKNLQILYRVDRLRDGVGAPQLQAIHVW